MYFDGAILYFLETCDNFNCLSTRADFSDQYHEICFVCHSLPVGFPKSHLNACLKRFPEISRDFQRFPEISSDFQRPTWMLVSSRYQRGKVGAGCVQWPKQCESGAAGGNLVNLGKNTLLGRLPTNATNCTSTFNNFRLQIRDFYEYVPSIHEIQSALFIGYVGTGYHFLQLDLFLLFS